jgi:hypothetical protein
MSQFLINHPNSSSSSVYNEQLHSGTINGIKRQTIHKLFNINSCIREDQAPGTSTTSSSTSDAVCEPNLPCQNCNRCCYLKKWQSSNFIVRLPENLDKVISLKLSAAEIPNTTYNISHTMKTNVFQVTDCSGTSIPVEIPSGNYDADQLVIIINNILGALGLNLTAEYDTISGRFFFYYTTDDADTRCGLDFRLPNDDRNIKMNLGWMLGFRKAIYCNEEYIEKDDVWTADGDHSWPCKEKTYTTDISMNAISDDLWSDKWPQGYIAEGILDITGPRYLFLVVNDFNNNVNNKYTSLVASRINFPASNILARISLPYGKNEIGFDDTSDLIPKTREYFGPVSIDKLHIQVVDEFGRIVDFNNNDISILLDFQCLYNL